ncbi:MAG: DegV family protein [Lachnospiraceae bacterium]|jgi:DegV family protein with EDD domain|nr:DegV family protein [Lachnospiraceae bacterium]
MAYQIITDGSCDLGREIPEETGIKVVPFYVTFDGRNYKKEIEELSVREFYQEMVDYPKQFPKSSLPSVQDYVEAFTPYVKEGKDIICLCITTKFSGSYNSAKTAAELLVEEYPSVRIQVVDTMVNTVLQGLLVLETVRMQQAGISFEQTLERIERIKSTGRIIFTVGNYEYLIHGGRIGKVMGSAASTLGIKPLIMLREGEIFPIGISRSRKKAMKRLIEQTKDHFDKIGESPDDYQIVVGYGYDYQEAKEFRDQLLTSLQTYSNCETIDIFQIGATIGVHTGPYPIGLGLIRRYERG